MSPEGRKNPLPLPSARRNGPTGLKFNGCLESVLRGPGGVWGLSVHMVMSGLVKSGEVKSSTGLVMSGLVKLGQVKSGKRETALVDHCRYNKPG